mgnify:CR=1 FL=1
MAADRSESSTLQALFEASAKIRRRTLYGIVKPRMLFEAIAEEADCRLLVSMHPPTLDDATALLKATKARSAAAV